MRSILVAGMVLALTSTSFAGGRDSYQPPKPSGNTQTTLAAALAGAKATSRSNANAIAKGGNAVAKGGSATARQRQNQSQSQTASANNEGVNVSQNYRETASSAVAPSGQTTAQCQKWFGAGGQGYSFGASFGFNVDSKRCWTLEQAAHYSRVYGKNVIRAYYEANDPVLRKIVQGK